MMKNLRISKYDPLYAEGLVEWMGLGRSFRSYAGSIGVGVRTLEEWCERYEEFATARELGEARSLEFWERELVAKATGAPDFVEGPNGEKVPRGQGHWEALKFKGKNAHPEEFKEKVEIGHSGSLSFVVDTGIDRTPLEVEGEVVRPKLDTDKDTLEGIGGEIPMPGQCVKVTGGGDLL